jgi:hypothetical protein
MGKKKHAYVARLKFPTYETKPFLAELTQGQADRIAEILEKYKKAGALEDYYLGPPDRMEHLHALVLPVDALKVELVDLIEMERRLSSDR